ncbi:COG0730 Predicted permeases [Comamonadaceae bacterium]
MELLIASLASGLAGFIDSIVGGGGLILTPALFALFPAAHPATLFGTNKGAAVAGTAFAAVQYNRRVSMPWKALLPATAVCFAAAMGGAWMVTQISPQYLRKALPFILVLVLGYTLAKKELGRHHVPRFSGQIEMGMACAIGGLIGFYDGFFGPGTGSFFVFLLVRVLGYDFLHASAGAKLLNTASNSAALVLFTFTGHVWWHYVAVMAVANVAGSLAGTHLALKHGTGFVRSVFIVVVSALILKTAYDAFLRGL